MIADRIARSKNLLPINHNYNTICDVLAPLKIKQTQEFPRVFLLAVKKKAILVQMARTVRYYIGMMRTVRLHCPVSAEIRTVDSQSNLRIWL